MLSDKKMREIIYIFYEGEKMDYKGIIERNINNIDSKICGIIDDYKVLNDSQKVADYIIQFLRTYVETIAARIYAHENPNEDVPIRGKDKWFSKYMKALKETKEYGYIWRIHDSLQIVSSHYVPEDDGAVRIMEMYLPTLFQLRDHMKDKFGLVLLNNLEDYPQDRNKELDPYYEKIYSALKSIDYNRKIEHTNDRYYIVRKKYRTVNGKWFFEYTLTYAQEDVTKFDRFVVYSFEDIPDNYSVQCDFIQTKAKLNGIDIDIKCIIAWNISIRPCELEKLAAVCGYNIKVRSDNSYYKKMMIFISKTGMNLLDIMLADEDDYARYIEQIELDKKPEFVKVFDEIRRIIIDEKSGSNILRYITAYLKNDVIKDQLDECSNNLLSKLYLRNEAIPFDQMPYASNLYKHIIPKARLHRCLELYDYKHQYVAAMVNEESYDSNALYFTVDDAELDYYLYERDIFNGKLHKSERQQLRKINNFSNHLYVENYYKLTKSVIEKLQQYCSEGVDGYSDMLVDKAEFIDKIDDDQKKNIAENIFQNSRLGMVYGAAGTGKTRVAEYIAEVFEGKRILLLANTNAAKNNLMRRINNYSECYTVYDYIKNGNGWVKYDLVIIDECSTVCNEDILKVFDKCNAKAFLLLGDVYQIEAIKFGNWFNFARYFVDKKSVYELLTPYRAKDKKILLDMWKYVRTFDENMFEILQANGFISSLNESIFEKDDDGTNPGIVLCLGYDGLYGVNNINRYMQKINESEPVEWGNWTYKVGDKVLFNENKRFNNVLYNNLKGRIISINKKTDEIVFQVLVDKVIDKTEATLARIKLVECDYDDKSIVEFNVKKRIERDSDADYSEEIVPFQIAYAVSIHKAQGLEYKSVKVVISEDIDERISHNIFYTAITRTTEKLKIYMSKETQKKLADKFVKSNVGLQQAQLFAGHAGLKLKNKLSS